MKPTFLNAQQNKGYVPAVLLPDGGRKPVSPIIYYSPGKAESAAESYINEKEALARDERSRNRFTLMWFVPMLAIGMAAVTTFVTFENPGAPWFAPIIPGVPLAIIAVVCHLQGRKIKV